MPSYIAEGPTATPFNRAVVNRTRRYHPAIDAMPRGAGRRSQAGSRSDLFKQRLTASPTYIQEYGEDMPEIVNWRWNAE